MKGNEPFQFVEYQSLLDGSLPSLGPDVRSNRERFEVLNMKLSQLLERGDVSADAGRLVRALILLWHDYLDQSHELSQEIHTIDGSFVHGIMHRREPDYGNAKYWFNRVGNHPAFAEISARVDALLRTINAATPRATLLPNGNWDPFAFIDACEMALKQENGREMALLQQIQEIESRVLLERFLR